MQYHTRTITSGSITINQADNVQFLSVIAADSTSSFSVNGGLTFQTVPSQAQVLTGIGMSLTNTNPASSMSGITITWLSGSVLITIGV